ncbi:hypothetical protein [Paucibacter soli]|uniref:hypothetical protein n=1 Tax=Paucibacter soli TaxID=3133433 RepID=UPI00309D0B78
MKHASALLLASLLSSVAFAAERAPPGRQFGGALQCAGANQTSTLLAAKSSSGFAPKVEDLTWALDSMNRVGYPASAPKAGPALEAATVASSLLRGGNLVAAKMARDEAGTKISDFDASQFAKSLEALLTILTQPVPHASYPTSVRAEGEHRVASSTHSHGADLEDMSASLAEIVGRAATSQKAMGDAYSKPAVRFYLLAHGFRDAIALESATAQVCAVKLNESTRRRLDVSARFMAMPSRTEVTQEPN